MTQEEQLKEIARSKARKCPSSISVISSDDPERSEGHL